MILYTGGTFGMEDSPVGFTNKKGYLLNVILSNKTFYDKEYSEAQQDSEKHGLKCYYSPETTKGKRLKYCFHEYEELIDSSQIHISDFKRIAKSIEVYYDSFDAFIIIHGTDTMDYTASVLSFMLENLRKPVIITGS